MTWFRAILCVIFPPLAVYDCGFGAILLTLVLSCLGWIPGMIAAGVILYNKKEKNKTDQQ